MQLPAETFELRRVALYANLPDAGEYIDQWSPPRWFRRTSPTTGLAECKGGCDRRVRRGMKAREIDSKRDCAVRSRSETHPVRRHRAAQHQICHTSRRFQRQPQLVIEHSNHSPPPGTAWRAVQPPGENPARIVQPCAA